MGKQLALLMCQVACSDYRVRSNKLSVCTNMPVYLDFLQVAKTKLQLAVCGSNLPTLLELVKPHNTC